MTLTPHEMKEQLIDQAFLSFNTKKLSKLSDVNSRTGYNRGEIVRIYYILPFTLDPKSAFLIIVHNKKKNILAIGSVEDAIRILKNKYPKGKPVDLQVCYPNTWEKKKRSTVNKLIHQSRQLTEQNWDTLIANFMLLLLPECKSDPQILS